MTQSGTYGTSSITQSTTNSQTPDRNNRVTVKQSGNSADSTVVQERGDGIDNRNRVFVEQDGDNTSSVSQAGTANAAEVHQGGGTGNDSTITQGGQLNAVGDAVDETASAGVTQFGNDNISDVTQIPGDPRGGQRPPERRRQ